MGLEMPFGWYIHQHSLEEHIYEGYLLELLTGCSPDSPMKGLVQSTRLNVLAVLQYMLES